MIRQMALVHGSNPIIGSLYQRPCKPPRLHGLSPLLSTLRRLTHASTVSVWLIDYTVHLFTYLYLLT